MRAAKSVQYAPLAVNLAGKYEHICRALAALHSIIYRRHSTRHPASLHAVPPSSHDIVKTAIV